MVNWIMPSLKEEHGEFERTARECGLNLESLVSLFESGTFQDFDDGIWEKLENTDSWSIKDLSEANLKAAECHRDAQAIYSSFKMGLQMQAPIILVRVDNTAHLVSGNTRLMICRAIGERPKVLILRTSF